MDAAPLRKGRIKTYQTDKEANPSMGFEEITELIRKRLSLFRISV